MSYTIVLTNGTNLTTVNDSSVDNTTSLSPRAQSNLFQMVLTSSTAQKVKKQIAELKTKLQHLQQKTIYKQRNK